MQKLEASSPEAQSADLLAGNIEQLKALFPELITEGANGVAVNVDVLKALVGDSTVTDTDEKYGLNWHGKRRARQLALTPSTGTLRPCPEESVDWDTTQNLMIEGDNLEVLKLLQKSYAGKVKLIYIDPPYNTGKDFVYPDNFQDNIKNYLELTGQVEGGQKISSNTEASGRFHTDWLNMIYPRLVLARRLLTADGVILISIGDEEVHNLRQLCDLVFGDESFCGVFVWEKKKKPSFLDRNMGSVTEYVVAYARNRDLSPSFVAGAVEDGKKYPFNNAGNSLGVLSFPAGSVRFGLGDQVISPQDMSEGNIKTQLLDEIQIVGGTNLHTFRLEGEWRYSQRKLDEFVEAEAEIVISKAPFRPNYVNRSGDVKKTANLLSHRVNGIPTNEDATQEMREMMGGDVMSYPKPSGLLKYLVRAITSGSDIVLDFFAGSGTSGVGTMLQNQEDGGSRRYVLVQLPEPLDKANSEQALSAEFCERIGKPPAITEITKERLRRVGVRLKGALDATNLDVGFRVFKLATGNILPWQVGTGDLALNLLEATDHVRRGRTEFDLHIEVLLRFGLDLCVPEETRLISGKLVRVVGEGVLFTCFDEQISDAEVEELARGIAAWRDELSPWSDVICVFRDAAFENDVAKTNLSATLEQAGFTSIRSI